MNAGNIREKLYDYIRVADEKKLKAIYTILEDDITEETEWWKNASLVSTLEKDYQEWEEGKAKGHTMMDIQGDLEKRRKKRNYK
jgi:hypothetical protein